MSLLFRSNHGKKTPITQETWQQVDSKSRFRIVPHPYFGFTIKFYEEYGDRFIDIVSSENDMQIKYFDSDEELIDALRACGANI